MVPVPYRLLAGALLLVGAAGSGYWRGHSNADRECEAVRQAEALAYAEQFQQEVERGNELALRFEKERQAARRQNRELAGAADHLGSCGAVGSGLVRLHDAAASETSLPATSGESACAPSAVTNAEFARTIVENYGACNDYIRQLNALIDWHTKE